MKLLVTGGAGYVGGATVEHLYNMGHEVIVLDNLLTGHKQCLPPMVQLVEGDLSNHAVLTNLFAENNFDAVFHFAALTPVGESVKAPALYYQNNLVNGLHLLDQMRSKNVQKIVFSSTAAVYGEPDHAPITEDCPVNPTSPYGDTKLAFERALQAYSQAYGLKYAALRYFNAAGATKNVGEVHVPETHLIPLILKVAIGQTNNLTVFGNDYNTPDGTCIRDYIHIMDLAEAHLAALQFLIASNMNCIFNLGSGHGYSVMEIIKHVRIITSSDIPIKIAPRRQGDPAVLVASNERISQQLGWQPSNSSIQQIITDAYNWLLNHPEGYRQNSIG